MFARQTVGFVEWGGRLPVQLTVVYHSMLMFLCRTNAVLWLGVRKSIQAVKIEWWGVGVVICQIVCIWSSWCHCHPKTLASFKSRLVLPFWYRLAQAVLEKRPLNGCSSISNYIHVIRLPVETQRTPHELVLSSLTPAHNEEHGTWRLFTDLSTDTTATCCPNPTQNSFNNYRQHHCRQLRALAPYKRHVVWDRPCSY